MPDSNQIRLWPVHFEREGTQNKKKNMMENITAENYSFWDFKGEGTICLKFFIILIFSIGI